MYHALELLAQERYASYSDYASDRRGSEGGEAVLNSHQRLLRLLVSCALSLLLERVKAF